MSKVVFDTITDEKREIMNVSEWCKKEACWKVMKLVDYNFDKNTLSALISIEVVEEERKNAATNQKLEDECPI